jgi:two-component system sensor histidine kinase TctE
LHRLLARFSLRRILLFRLLVFLLPLMALTLAGAYFATLYFANGVFDRSLARRAYALADQVNVQGGKVTVDLPKPAHDVLEFDPTDVFYYRVIGPDGANLAGTSDLSVPASVPDAARQRAVYFDGQVEGDNVRIAVFRLSLAGTHASGQALILVGETVAKRELMAREVIVVMLPPMLLLLLLTVYAVSKGVDMSLAPVRTLENAVRRRSPHDLSGLKVNNLPTEVQPLLDEMNRLLGDLSELHNSHQEFVADAAHQLRTPLAAARAQIELLLHDSREDKLKAMLRGVLASLDRQTHLVSQLLALSRAEGHIGPATLQPLDLVRLIHAAASEWAPRALERGLDLAFESPEKEIWVKGDANSLTEAFINLLENSLRYAGKDGQVVVGVERLGSDACLTVSDNGPGVPESALPRLFERFYRVPGNTIEGCGLGLAIVKKVAQAHGGSVEAGTGAGGRGFRVCLRLPAIEAPERK